ncbi:MAG TPA: class I SAM-dependent methyltransferase [Candidatus Limnocylindria bacterium]|nr:class I SAM-dependent methyltransferase [Candidatus Limnocylindria bacterium]
MLLETFKNFKDFELLDTGAGFRLERWGNVILQRPDPQIIWGRSLLDSEWDKAWAIYKSANDEGKENWEIKKSIPKPWIIEFNNVRLLLKLSPFKHTGLFAEQAAQWEWMENKLSSSSSYQVKSKTSSPKILNLFAYTGGATMVLAQAGCNVTHVDASKPAITWANENHALNKLPKDSVRWMLDDCVKFVKREVKRGAKYDGIIMDPPAFGHSPTGKTWKFNYDLPGLLLDCVQLLSNDAKFLVINGYATNSSALALNNLLTDAIKSRPASASWRIEFGELCLKQKTDRMISTGIFARWSA